MGADKPYVCEGPKHHRLKNPSSRCPICSASVILFEESDMTEINETLTLPDPAKIKIYHASDNDNTAERTPTGIGEFDNILGGGFAPGEVVLFAGTPGAGKSTLLATVAQSMAEKGNRILYFSGEESEMNVASRHKRVGATSDLIDIVSSNKATDALALLNSGNYQLVIIDSIQTIKEKGANMVDIAYQVCAIAHTTMTPVVMVGHVTKDDKVGGPMTLTHTVDAVLTLSEFGDEGLRLLRSPKNRYGSTDVTACFKHEANAFVEVPDPSGILDSRTINSIVGIGPTVLLEGNKPILAEIQSMVADPIGINPQFVAQGIQSNKARVIAAAVSKAGVAPIGKDVYLSVGGGIRTNDSGIDLAVAAAFISATTYKHVNTRTVFLGEILLTGEVKGSRGQDFRIREANKLGYLTVGNGCNTQVDNVKDLAKYVMSIG